MIQKPTAQTSLITKSLVFSFLSYIPFVSAALFMQFLSYSLFFLFLPTREGKCFHGYYLLPLLVLRPYSMMLTFQVSPIFIMSILIAIEVRNMAIKGKKMTPILTV